VNARYTYDHSLLLRIFEAQVNSPEFKRNHVLDLYNFFATDADFKTACRVSDAAYRRQWPNYVFYEYFFIIVAKSFKISSTQDYLALSVLWKYARMRAKNNPQCQRYRRRWAAVRQQVGGIPNPVCLIKLILIIVGYLDLSGCNNVVILHCMPGAHFFSC
jgi:hypothetical protein